MNKYRDLAYDHDERIEYPLITEEDWEGAREEIQTAMYGAPLDPIDGHPVPPWARRYDATDRPE